MANATIFEGAPNIGTEFSSVAGFANDAQTLPNDTATIVDQVWNTDDAAPVSWTKPLTIVAVGAAKQIGRPFRALDTHYRHRVASGAGHAFITATGAHVTMTDLEIQSGASGASDELFRAAAQHDGTFTNCVLGFANAVDQQDCWYNPANADQTVIYDQCVFSRIGRAIYGAAGNTPNATVNVTFNSCSGWEISAFTGAWYRQNRAGVGSVNTVHFHNCSTPSDGAIVIEMYTDGISNCNYTQSLTNHPLATFAYRVDNLVTTGSGFDYTWGDNPTPGGVDNVIHVDLTAPDVPDLRLQDVPANDAIAFHAVRTSAAGVTIPALDLDGNARDITTPLFDVGMHAVTLSGAPSFVDAVGAGDIGIDGQGTTDRLVTAFGAGDLAIDGEGTTDRLVTALGAGDLAFDGEGTINAFRGGAGFGDLSIDGEGTGNIVGGQFVDTQGAGTIGIDGEGTGVVGGLIDTAGFGDITFDGFGTGQRESIVDALGAGTIAIDGEGAGSIIGAVLGEGAGTLSIDGSGTPQVERIIDAVADGRLSIDGEGAGTVSGIIDTQGFGNITFDGTGTGHRTTPVLLRATEPSIRSLTPTRTLRSVTPKRTLDPLT